ncbi:MAG: tetratricopeptide repeat protein [Oscillibacter sp.]|jgi:tetratricopeptide (TPR) repeat protein|nr:tetratricopeptide repeat protein [Oscillibacter sp.]
MDKSRTRRYHRPSTKAVALILAAVLTASIAVNAAVTVKITGGDSSQAAKNYLVDSTDYVHKNRFERISELAGTLKNPTTLEDYYRLASTQIAAENYSEALDSVERCLSLYFGGDRELELDLWLKKACLQVILGKDEDALTSLDSVQHMDPSLANAYLIRAQIYAKQDDMEPLAQALSAYLTLKPEDSDVRGLLAQAMFTQGDYQGATAQYETILDTAPAEADLSQTEYLYALTCIQLGDFKTAEKNLSAALEKDDSLDGISYYRGVCRMSLGNYAGAVKDFSAAIGKDDMTQASYYSRGLCRMMSEDGAYDKALTDVRKAVSLDAKNETGRQAAALLTQLETAQRATAEADAKAAAEKAAREKDAKEKAAANEKQQSAAADTVQKDTEGNGQSQSDSKAAS